MSYLFGCVLFVSAFLLFQIQPMIAKQILPRFGGSASVWSTCMLFFQCLLLAGYGYAHWLVRPVRAKRQRIVHIALLLLTLIALPVRLPEGWNSFGDRAPALQLLALLSVSVGLPYFALATTAPLVQAWFAARFSGRSPYRLYALSNFASLLSLLGYPLGVEYFLRTGQQLTAWSGAYLLFVALCGWLAFSVPVAKLDPERQASTEKLSREQQGLWIALAACASTLLLAVTQHMTQNLAPNPLLWVLPLSVYLLTFILAFDSDRWYSRSWSRWAIVPALIALLATLPPTLLGMMWAIPASLAGLFICCLFCHGEIARLKPAPEHLTRFYLSVSLGGALGGVFVSLLAPVLLTGYFELPLVLAMTGVLALHLVYRPGSPARLVRLSVFVLVAFAVSIKLLGSVSGVRVMERDFYGASRVEDVGTPNTPGHVRLLLHGATFHGAQLLDPKRRREPITYYGPQSGIGRLLRVKRASRVAVIGLGTGTLATYARTGDYYRFYELDPLVLRIAEREFSFLRDSAARSETVLGDGRLQMAAAPDQNLDVLVLDAFSGDSVPVHLLTREAFALYFRHLRSDGVLAINITNRYLELLRVVRPLAESFDRQCVAIDSPADPAQRYFRALWVLIGREHALPDEFQADRLRGAEAEKPLPLWTDDYSNLLSILRW